jgi:uncharacterized protein YjiS (DUF1127 family)
MNKPKMKTFIRSIGAFVTASAAFATIYIGKGSGSSKLARWWRNRDKSRHALAALDDDQLSHLSDIGRQIRRDERHGGRR